MEPSIMPLQVRVCKGYFHAPALWTSLPTLPFGKTIYWYQLLLGADPLPPQIWSEVWGSLCGLSVPMEINFDFNLLYSVCAGETKLCER